jgi:hypothetical protein
MYKFKDMGPSFHSFTPEIKYLTSGLHHFSKSNIQMWHNLDTKAHHSFKLGIASSEKLIFQNWY